MTSQEMKARWRRLARALRYARARLTDDDAESMRNECQRHQGLYPLVCLGASSVLEIAQELYGDSSEVEDLTHEACDHVSRKWEDNAGIAALAEDWVLELIDEYARNLGLARMAAREQRRGDGMNAYDKRDFKEYLRNCTDSQVRGVFEKENAAGREEYADMARTEAMHRGISLNE